jgi:DNA repair exonuclease SbcCD ATPase subunit
LVSHVVELAERVPTRFEVRKGPGGSTVERIDR